MSWQPEGLIPPQAAWVLDSPLRRLISPRVPVLNWAGIRRGEDVLEIGPVPGYFNLALAARAAPGQVYAVELQSGMMARLQRKLARVHSTHVQPILGDACRIPLAANSVDFVFAYSVLEEVPDIGAAVLEITRLLRPAGKVAVAQFMFDFSAAMQRVMCETFQAADFTVLDESVGRLMWRVRFRKGEARRSETTIHV